MKKFTFIFLATLFSIHAQSVDIIGNFNLSSFGKYYPYENNGTMYVNFDFVVDNGPITTPFKIGFYVSTDMIITTSDFRFHQFTVNNCNTGSSAFPDQFGSAAPYKIPQMLTISGIPKNQNVFFGIILDYANAITETDEANNGGPVNMAPFQITGNVGISASFNPNLISIAPNPIRDYTIIDLKGFQSPDLVLKVMDISGRIVSVSEQISFPYVWNRSQLHNGIYFFIFEYKSVAVLRKKVILE